MNLAGFFLQQVSYPGSRSRRVERFFISTPDDPEIRVVFDCQTLAECVS